MEKDNFHKWLIEYSNSFPKGFRVGAVDMILQEYEDFLKSQPVPLIEFTGQFLALSDSEVTLGNYDERAILKLEGRQELDRKRFTVTVQEAWDNATADLKAYGEGGSDGK